MAASLFAGGTLTLLSRSPRRVFAHAQGASGKITVSFEGGNDLISGLVDQAVQAVRAANPGADIELQVGAAGLYTTQLVLAMMSGTGPDVFLTTGLGIGELGAGGLIEPLDGYLETWDGWAEYPENIRAAMTY
jgi:multiple sugar transport system substrate-binding protein